jgi:general secretion pathway protein K
MHNKSHKGSALISALFIMTLVAIAATAMSTRLQLDIYRTRMAILNDKVYLASQAVVFWGMSELSNKKNTFRTANADGRVLQYPAKLQNMYPGMRINGALYDLQARLNLNNLKDNHYYLIFINLLSNAVPELNERDKNTIADAVKNWITPYTPDVGKDVYMGYYLQQKPPYFPSKQLFTGVSELRLVMNVSAIIYQKLAPFITALPETTPININTASKKILLSLNRQMTDAQFSELITARGKQGMKDLSTISEILRKLNIRSETLTVKSTYFLTIATVKAEDLTLVTYTILKRVEEKNGEIKVTLIKDSINTL